MSRLLAGVAALAIASTPALAQPGKNGSSTNDDRGKPAAAAKQSGNGAARKAAQEQPKPPAKKASAPAKRNSNNEASGNKGRDIAHTASPAQSNASGKSNAPAKADAPRSSKSAGSKASSSFKGNGNVKGNGQAGAVIRNAGHDRATILDRNDRNYAGSLLRDLTSLNRGLITGCPPGLAKKRNGCLPPGQAKIAYRSYRPSLFGFAGLAGASYYLNDGYLLSYGNDRLVGFIPLLAGALSIGNEWPKSYATNPLPDYYVDYYRLGSRPSYRYADNVIYRVDPDTAAISSVAAILTGDEFVIGQPMPRGYSVYNVPYSYRDRYYDTPEAHYRYADGYIYRIDPETALITAAIDMLI